MILQFSLLLKRGFRAIHSLVTSPARGHHLCLKLQIQFSVFFCLFVFFLFQLCLFNEATAPGMKPYQAHYLCVLCVA